MGSKALSKTRSSMLKVRSVGKRYGQGFWGMRGTRLSDEIAPWWGQESRRAWPLSLSVDAAALLLVARCSENRSRSESRSIRYERAKSVEANFGVKGENLKVPGDADGLIETDFTHKGSGFTYHDAFEWTPKVDYGVRGEQTELSVELPDARGTMAGTVVDRDVETWSEGERS